MKLTTALNLTKEEFEQLDQDCGGFNDAYYKNNEKHSKDETQYEFILKGSKRIKNDPLFKGKLK